MRLAQRCYVAFPPRSGFLLLPRRPARAARAGLALYEAALPRQRFALTVGRAIVGAGLARVLPPARSDEVDWSWWQRLADDVVAPLAGTVTHLALRVPGTSRHSALMMARDGHPVAFAKILDTVTSELADRASRLLGAERGRTFRVPRLLDSDSLAGVAYQVFEPLPEGTHQPPPHDPARVRRVIDGFRTGLAELPRPAGTPSTHVPVHNEFTPRNLRVMQDGTWWLFDLDRVRFGPPLVDELRYWCAAYAYRRRPHIERDAARILALLRVRGSDAEIIEAVAWTGHVPRTYLPIEEELRAAVGRAAARAAEAAEPA